MFKRICFLETRKKFTDIARNVGEPSKSLLSYWCLFISATLCFPCVVTRSEAASRFMNMNASTTHHPAIRLAQVFMIAWQPGSWTRFKRRNDTRSQQEVGETIVKVLPSRQSQAHNQRCFIIKKQLNSCLILL